MATEILTVNVIPETRHRNTKYDNAEQRKEAIKLSKARWRERNKEKYLNYLKRYRTKQSIENLKNSDIVNLVRDNRENLDYLMKVIMAMYPKKGEFIISNILRIIE
jgi:hypothetical protein